MMTCILVREVCWRRNLKVVITLFFGLLAGCQATYKPPQIIDVHRHAPLANSDSPDNGPHKMLLDLGKHNVVLSVVSVTSPEQAKRWSRHGSDRLLLGAMLPCPVDRKQSSYHCFPGTRGLPDIDWLRKSIQNGTIGALHEVMFNYDGTLPDHPKMAPYWALAEEFGVPVGVHSWSGPPPGRSIRENPDCCPDYDGEMGNPVHLRPVLDRHPGLRIWLQHVGSDGDAKPQLWQQTLDLLADYPNVYVDLSITNSVLPIEQYESALNRLIDAGFGNRIMLGSDNVSLGLILERLESLESISDGQRAAILYDNAAQFFGLAQKSED